MIGSGVVLRKLHMRTGHNQSYPPDVYYRLLIPQASKPFVTGNLSTCPTDFTTLGTTRYNGNISRSGYYSCIEQRGMIYNNLTKTEEITTQNHASDNVARLVELSTNIYQFSWREIPCPSHK